MTPTIGRIVHVHGLNPAENNGATEAPAIITRVWSQADDHWTINAKVLLDAEKNAWRTSLYLYDDPAAATSSTFAVWPPLTP